MNSPSIDVIAESLEDASPYSIDNKGFKDIIDTMVKEFKGIIQIYHEVNLLQKDSQGGTLVYELPDGRQIGRPEANELIKQFASKLKELPKYHQEAGRKKKRPVKLDEQGNPIRREGAFSRPAFYGGETYQFLTNADFGDAYVRDENGQWVSAGPLRDRLEAIRGYGFTRSVAKLLSIYRKHHNIPGSKTFPLPQEMRQIYSQRINELFQEDQTNPRYRKANKTDKAAGVQTFVNQVDGKDYVSNNLNLDNVQYITFTRFHAPDRIKTANYTEQQEAIIADPEAQGAVEAESAIVTSTAEYYKALEEAAKPPKSPAQRGRKSRRDQQRARTVLVSPFSQEQTTNRIRGLGEIGSPTPAVLDTNIAATNLANAYTLATAGVRQPSPVRTTLGVVNPTPQVVNEALALNQQLNYSQVQGLQALGQPSNF